MEPDPEKSNEDPRHEIEAILAEYQHQKMLESLIGPLVSMVVHVAVVVFLVFFISMDQPSAAPEVSFTMKAADEAKATDEPPPPEPPPTEMDIPTIDVATPAADSAASSAAISSFSEVGGQTFAIAPSSSPYKVRVPSGSGAGVGFGSGGGTGMGSGSGGRPTNAMVGRLFVVKLDPAGRPNVLGIQEAAKKMNATTYRLFFEKYLNNYLMFLEGKLPVNPAADWFMVRDKVLYSKAFFFPPANSAAGPAKFGVSEIVGNPSYWIAHYSAIFPVARDMRFRFQGTGDDELMVLVNRQLVLNGSAGFSKGMMPSYKHMEPGSSQWVSAKRDEKLQIDLFFGEAWGGSFRFELWIEIEGKPEPVLFATDELSDEEIKLLRSQGIPASKLAGGMINPSALDKFMRRLQEVQLTVN